MQINITRTIIFRIFLFLGLAAPYLPVGLQAQDERKIPIMVNLIVDGSAAFGGVRDEVSNWVSGSLIDRLLRDGDQVTVWDTGGTARIAYSGALKTGEKEQIQKAIAAIAAKGEAPDFSGALREAAARSPAEGITYTLLVSASPAGLAPTLNGSGASLVKFSRIEEFRGWRVVVVALGIDAKVRQAASAWLAGA